MIRPQSGRTGTKSRRKSLVGASVRGEEDLRGFGVSASEHDLAAVNCLQAKGARGEIWEKIHPSSPAENSGSATEQGLGVAKQPSRLHCTV